MSSPTRSADLESPDVRAARVRFLTTDEGGRHTAPRSGTRSQIELNEFQTSCIVESTSGVQVLPLGEYVEVEIRILIVDQAGAAFAEATSVKLFEGNKLVAVGVFVDR